MAQRSLWLPCWTFSWGSRTGEYIYQHINLIINKIFAGALHLSDTFDIINHDILQYHLKDWGLETWLCHVFAPHLLWLVSLKDTTFSTNFKVLALIRKYLYSFYPAYLKEWFAQNTSQDLNLSSGLLWMPSRKKICYNQPGVGLLSGNTKFVEFSHCLILSNWYYLVKIFIVIL